MTTSRKAWRSSLPRHDVDADGRHAQRLGAAGDLRAPFDLELGPLVEAVEHAEGGDLLAGRAGVGGHPFDARLVGRRVLHLRMLQSGQGQIVADDGFDAFGADRLQCRPAIGLPDLGDHRVADGHEPAGGRLGSLNWLAKSKRRRRAAGQCDEITTGERVGHDASP